MNILTRKSRAINGDHELAKSEVSIHRTPLEVFDAADEAEEVEEMDDASFEATQISKKVFSKLFTNYTKKENIAVLKACESVYTR
jgi:hypothetical protein